jgi:hypothetical protein
MDSAEHGLTDAPDDPLGAALVNLDFLGTGLFAATAIGGALLPESFLAPVSATVAGALFVIGVVAFLWAYAVAVSRSRDDLIGIGGLFFLAGSKPETAPKAVRFRLRLALAAQVLVAFGTAAARPYTIAAFGILVPVFGIGLMGLWGARHGEFAARLSAGEPASPE